MNQLDYDEIRVRVEQRLGGEKFKVRASMFATNLLLFVIFAITMVALYNTRVSEGVSMEGIADLAILPLVGWITALFMQGITLALDSRPAERSMRERLVAREITRQVMEEGVLSEKPKRAQHTVVGISDDGELMTLEDEEPPARRSARRD
jgi:hypothetical protein